MASVALSRGFLPSGFLRSRPGRFVWTQVPACRSSQNENDTGEGKFMNGSLLVENFVKSRLCRWWIPSSPSAYGLWRNSRTEFSVRSSSPAQQSDRRSPRSNTVSKHFNRAKFDFFRLGHWRQTVRWCGRKRTLEETWPFVWPTSRSTSVSRWRLALGVSCLRLTSSFLLRATSTSSLWTT